jgi:divalent metal cation (Fe/Co/Zn/Cd) transporter
MRRRAVRLEYLTLTSVTVEAVVGLVAGVGAKSIALISFGLDSIIEFMAALIVLWQLSGRRWRTGDDTLALRLVAVTFFGLALYIVAESADTLRHHHKPEDSVVGIVLTVASLIAMRLLGTAKQRLGHAMESDVLEADAAETLLCSYLAIVVLVGLLLNSLVGWWWADPVAALVIALLAMREGIEAWRGGHH